MSRYTVVITGPIGAGKTTQCTSLVNSLKDSVFVPEFLDDTEGNHAEEARLMLKNWIAGTVSLIDFQGYIASSQDRILSRLHNMYKDRPDVVFVMERLPSDALIFSRDDHGQEGEHYERIKEWSREVESKHNIRSSEPVRYSVLDGDLEKKAIQQMILSIIETDMKDDKFPRMTRVIRLNPSVGVCVQRVAIRNRPEEQEYKISYLRRVMELYDRYETICLL